MNKGLRITVTVIIILLIAGMIAYPKLKPFLSSKLGKESIAGSPLRQGQQKLNAAGMIVTPSHMSVFVRSTGTLRPAEETDLTFETSGKIVAIYFTEGTRVKKGALLAKINDKPLQAQLEKLEVELKLAEAKEYRQKSLLGKDAISQESYDQIVTDLQGLKADINLVKARISETELRAPFDGTIGLRYVSEGAFSTASTKIARLVQISPIKIEFSISEKYSSDINIGYPITFAVNEKLYNASVYAIDPKIDIDTRVISIRALYQNKKEELKPGTYALITLEMAKVDSAMAIPTEALIPEMEGEKVYIYKKGKAQQIPVTTGLRTESKIQITEGLKFGDTLLVTGILQLRQNLPIVLDTVYINK
jgi:membrane fusion protein (multidrug efflux system)